MTLNMSQLRWRCRRGMKELDLMLMTFMDAGYIDLYDDEKKDFERLLECQDADLYEYLMGYSAPEDRELHHVIDKIRSTT
jgi:antitoxin CptB